MSEAASAGSSDRGPRRTQIHAIPTYRYYQVVTNSATALENAHIHWFGVLCEAQHSKPSQDADFVVFESCQRRSTCSTQSICLSCNAALRPAPRPKVQQPAAEGAVVRGTLVVVLQCSPSVLCVAPLARSWSRRNTCGIQTEFPGSGPTGYTQQCMMFHACWKEAHLQVAGRPGRLMPGVPLPLVSIHVFGEHWVRCRGGDKP